MQQQSMCQLSASARIRVRVKARVRVRVRVRIRLALKLLDHSLSLLLLQAEHQNPCSKAFSLWYLNFQAHWVGLPSLPTAEGLWSVSSR